MRLLFILLVSLACADALAQVSHRPDPRDDGGDYYRSDEDWHERRRSLRAFREEIRQQEEAARQQAQSRQQRYNGRGASQNRSVAPAPDVPDQPDADRRRLRRLSPEDRQRMREEMREVFRH